MSAGRVTAAEIAEQPTVLARVLDEGLPTIRAVAKVVVERAPRFVLFNARGTSDNASFYAKYLVEVLLGMPAGMTSPSTTTVYGVRPDLRDCLVVAVSQSGSSPDLVESTEVARECGALTLAVTNVPDSPLASVSELTLDVLAGPELAVPATKTYTAQLLTLWALVDAWRGGSAAEARGVPDLAAGVLARADEVARLAARYRFASELVTTGRGYSFPTAREAALKVMETSFLSAHAWSGADLLHGPLAMVDERIPVIALAAEGPGGAAIAPVLDRLRERGADLCVVGSVAAVAAAPYGFALPAGVADTVSPVLEIMPLQRLAWEIAVARGYDPDQPRGLAKVTETR
jgi:glucosamine--fructose-6-phosphate aminotransferase (isomerizing)